MTPIDRRTLFRTLSLASLAMPLAGCSITPMQASAGDNRSAPVDDIAKWLKVLDSTENLQSGSEGDVLVALRTEEHLKENEFETERQSVKVPTFSIEECEVRIGETVIPVYPQHRVVQTSPGGITSKLAWWRLGMPTTDLAGKIAVVELSHSRHSQLMARPSREPLLAALAAKPAAIILLTTGATGETVILNAPYENPVASIPIAVLGPKPGAALVKEAHAGGVATLVIRGRAGESTSDNLIATRDRGTAPLVISTPRTAWTPAVAERGPGFAAFMQLASWLPKAFPSQSLVFVQTTAHEFDNAGGEQFLASDLAPPPEAITLWIHLGAGFAGRSFHDLGFHQLVPLPGVDDQRFLLGTNDLVEELERAFRGQPGLERIYSEADAAVGELAEVLKAGYSPAFGLLGGHIYHHTMSDRLDKTDPVWIAMAIESVKTVIRGRLA